MLSPDQFNLPKNPKIMDMPDKVSSPYKTNLYMVISFKNLSIFFINYVKSSNFKPDDLIIL